MTLFQCAGCSESIPSHKVRLHCEVCYDYSLCANCAILGVVTPPHAKAHPTTLLRESGFASVQSSPIAVRGPQRPLMQAWATLFDMETLEARPSGIDLLSAIFDCVAEKTGIMTPEAYSSLLDLVDCPIEDNIWKDTLQSAKGPNKERQAIDMLRQYFDAFSIDYDLYDVAIESDQGTESHEAPCLTRRGFIKLWKADCLHNPDRACDEANLILQNFTPAIWKDRGDVPRSVFPQERMSYEDQEAFYAARKKASRTSKLPSPPPRSASTATATTTRPSLVMSRTWTDTLAYARPKQIVPDRELWASSIQAAKEAKEALEIQKARQELDQLRERNERDLADLRRSNEMEFIRAQQEMQMDSIRSLERSKSVMGDMGHDRNRDYVLERFYR